MTKIYLIISIYIVYVCSWSYLINYQCVIFIHDYYAIVNIFTINMYEYWLIVSMYVYSLTPAWPDPASPPLSAWWRLCATRGCAWIPAPLSYRSHPDTSARRSNRLVVGWMSRFLRSAFLSLTNGTPLIIRLVSLSCSRFSTLLSMYPLLQISLNGEAISLPCATSDLIHHWRAHFVCNRFWWVSCDVCYIGWVPYSLPLGIDIFCVAQSLLFWA